MKDKEKMEYVQSMPMMQMPVQCCPIMDMENMEDEGEQRLEMMYPETYYIIRPAVVNRCDIMETKHGEMHIPDREEMDEMIEEICDEVEEEVEKEIKSSKDNMSRQFGYGRRRLLRDLVGVSLIGELLGRRRRRRRRRPFPHPPYGGYPPYYGPYPWYPQYPIY
ncbi:hypothetical protein [Fonticella tunisiensis]|uniref:Uncharacterized protein n=1 Tax=Fonticella tunisiensis TaxID=1096341 RepID=A0A4R7KEG4_9CLOT|nr:hypothetical protein [Fonticella tunisiensis]TDT51961.1 hypothetical protein EDD71_11647 [Fonticella tunisiensis]